MGSWIISSILIIFVLCISLSYSEQNVKVQWTGKNSINWFDPANWDTLKVPNSNDTAIVRYNGEINVNGDISLSTLTLIGVKLNAQFHAISADTLDLVNSTISDSPNLFFSYLIMEDSSSFLRCKLSVGAIMTSRSGFLTLDNTQLNADDAIWLNYGMHITATQSYVSLGKISFWSSSVEFKDEGESYISSKSWSFVETTFSTSFHNMEGSIDVDSSSLTYFSPEITLGDVQITTCSKTSFTFGNGGQTLVQVDSLSNLGIINIMGIGNVEISVLNSFSSVGFVTMENINLISYSFTKIANWIELINSVIYNRKESCFYPPLLSRIGESSKIDILGAAYNSDNLFCGCSSSESENCFPELVDTSTCKPFDPSSSIKERRLTTLTNELSTTFELSTSRITSLALTSSQDLTTVKLTTLSAPTLTTIQRDEITTVQLTTKEITSTVVTSNIIPTSNSISTGVPIQVTSNEITTKFDPLSTTSGGLSTALLTTFGTLPVTSAGLTTDPLGLTTQITVGTTLDLTSHTIPEGITTSQITSYQITSNEITTSKITSGDIPITSSELTSQLLTSSEVTTQSITSQDTQGATTSAYTTQDVTSSQFTTQDVTSSRLTSNEITSSFVTTSQISTDSLTTNNQLITSSQLSTQSITTQDSLQTTSELTTADVTTSEITSSVLLTTGSDFKGSFSSSVPNQIDVVSGSYNAPANVTLSQALSDTCAYSLLSDRCNSVSLKLDQSSGIFSAIFDFTVDMNSFYVIQFNARVGGNFGNSNVVWKFSLMGSSTDIPLLETQKTYQDWVQLNSEKKTITNQNEYIKKGDQGQDIVKIQIVGMRLDNKNASGSRDQLDAENQSRSLQVDTLEIKYQANQDVQKIETDEKDHRGAFLAAIIVPVLVVVIAVVVVGLVFYKRRASEISKKDEEWIAMMKSRKKMVNCKELQDIQVKKKIGGGNFGEVFRGLAFDGTVTVALKKLKEEYIDDFLNEAQISDALVHPNIVQFLGFYSDEKTRERYMVTEFCNNGSLQDHLNKFQGDFEYFELLLLAQGCARGMAYLEEHGIIHRDLACRNLLLSGVIVKVSDFGMSRASSNNIYEGKKGTLFAVRWAAPEVLKYQKFSSKSDVWSYGITLYEIITYGGTPYKGRTNVQVFELVADTDDKLLVQPAGCPDPYWNLVTDCLNRDPELRPTFKEVCRRIEEMMSKEEISPKVRERYNPEGLTYLTKSKRSSLRDPKPMASTVIPPESSSLYNKDGVDNAEAHIASPRVIVYQNSTEGPMNDIELN